MHRMTVQDFSCIKQASIEITPITLLIGPQASGKSVLTKLLYFFNDILQIQYQCAEESYSIQKFKNHLLSRFKDWFPISAWGNKKFKIEYESGSNLVYRILRRGSSSRVSDEIEIELSPFFEKQYSELLKNMTASRRRVPVEEEDSFFGTSYEHLWQVRRSSTKKLAEVLKSDFVSSQTFIPAGRSFFTNLGKAIAILDHGNQLDEMTRDFGRSFASLLDGHRYYYPDKPTQNAQEFINHQKFLLESLFEGSIRITHNDRHVDTKDGRKIPFAILSSGQQELLPLLLILQQKVRNMAHFPSRSSQEMIYVEEPEAHLFPSAQGKLVEYIASISAFFKKTSTFLITTHSPYVISKFNNLIKAHNVAIKGDDDRKKRVQGIVDQRSWIAPASVSAYALDGGILRSIKDSSGLIDGRYLDEISEDLSDKFLSLLEVETEYANRPLLPTKQQIENKIK